jgi:hypothetical protein
MPLIVGIAEPVILSTARTAHGEFVREVVRNYGLAVSYFREGYRHFWLLWVFSVEESGAVVYTEGRASIS